MEVPKDLRSKPPKNSRIATNLFFLPSCDELESEQVAGVIWELGEINPVSRERWRRVQRRIVTDGTPDLSPSLRNKVVYLNEANRTSVESQLRTYIARHDALSQPPTGEVDKTRKAIKPTRMTRGATPGIFHFTSAKEIPVFFLGIFFGYFFGFLLVSWVFWVHCDGCFCVDKNISKNPKFSKISQKIPAKTRKIPEKYLIFFLGVFLKVFF